MATRRKRSGRRNGGRNPSPPRGTTPFVRRVRAVVLAIPRGRTLSYGEVALRAGKPRGARAVVRALHQLDDVPWWRVIRSDGTLAPQVAHDQAQLLAAEGARRPTRARRTSAGAAARRWTSQSR